MTHLPRPLGSRLELTCEPNAVAWARRHTADVLRRWQLPSDSVEVAQLLVSELSTNAVRHVPPPTGPPWETRSLVSRFVLTLTYRPGRLLIEVYDHDRRPPVVRRADEGAEGGRGLLLVQALSRHWGYTYPTPACGKVVWCEVTVAPADIPAHATAQRPRTGSAEASEAPPRAEGGRGPERDAELLSRTLAGLYRR